MDNKKLNTTVEFEFCDGTKTELTLTFYKLYQLKAKNKKAYEGYMKIMAKEDADEIEMCQLLYIAYLCGHLDEEEVLKEEDFIELCGSDREALGNAVSDLLKPKKK